MGAFHFYYGHLGDAMIFLYHLFDVCFELFYLLLSRLLHYVGYLQFGKPKLVRGIRCRHIVLSGAKVKRLA